MEDNGLLGHISGFLFWRNDLKRRL